MLFVVLAALRTVSVAGGERSVEMSRLLAVTCSRVLLATPVMAGVGPKSELLSCGLLTLTSAPGDGAGVSSSEPMTVVRYV